MYLYFCSFCRTCSVMHIKVFRICLWIIFFIGKSGVAIVAAYTASMFFGEMMCWWSDFVPCRETESWLSKVRMASCTTGSYPPSSSCSKTWRRKEGILLSSFVHLEATYLECSEPCSKRWMKGLIHCSPICLISRWSRIMHELRHSHHCLSERVKDIFCLLV